MITKFSCENFRNIFCKDLAFSRVNVMIGANNAGKSNFIRAISFAANMVSNPSTEQTGFLTELKRNGWNAVHNKYRDGNTFRLSWDFVLKKERRVRYTLGVNTGTIRDENYISEEVLDSAETREGNDKPYNYFRCHTENIGEGKFSSAGMNNKKNRRLRASVDQNETVLLQMDKLFFTNKEMFSAPFVREEIRNVLITLNQYFQSFYAYSCTSFNLAAIREMQDEQNDGNRLKKDGSNFVNVYARMCELDQTFEKAYIGMLRRLSGAFEKATVRNANGKVWMELCISGKDFSLSEVSDGTIHLLLLLLLLNLPGKSGISMLAIDEPEMNLHPAWQKQLAREILRCNSFQQCFISTHSPDFLDVFTESFMENDTSVIVFDPASKKSIRKLKPAEFEEDLQDWTLGDLYRIGDPMIGGWPQ